MEVENPTIEKMKEDILSVKQALHRLEETGLSMEIMILYICDKTKLGKNIVRRVLTNQEEFLERAFEELEVVDDA